MNAAQFYDLIKNSIETIKDETDDEMVIAFFVFVYKRFMSLEPRHFFDSDEYMNYKEYIEKIGSHLKENYDAVLQHHNTFYTRNNFYEIRLVLSCLLSAFKER
ncbi:hypothetical protein [Flavobacterium sp. C4GT6]|uniref:hypothetical protein n=1 Tax=Flavobacterium sp. C4GT6 TaxID=3103818 RepID=UPI002ED5C87F